ncbi:hypothetical protein [Sandaracinus amylolyticus]|uniref:Uncharacterized protein n=1 Tax=Sandaracinus amylolyticus TaxID=927083 RepID=A0A0F6W7Y3_9BACT|nr:hypothetical protein [Sandaracinus amylolyticus]AKF09596.1 hypothetical protein DB32_006745 [Sandaracinus amylolyticus]
MTLVVALALALLSGCGGGLRRFPLAEPMWLDRDRRPFTPQPPEWYSPYVWDGADNSVFRPLADVWRFELDREAVNVNAMDEVPDSSWYTNRLSRGPLSPIQIAYGPCADVDPAIPGVDDDVPGPLTIVRGKPDGSNPGFFVRDANGQMYLMKPDGDLQAERPSASDAIAASVYWSAGFFAPCNRVVFVRREDLVLDPGAEVRRTDGRRGPLAQQTVDEILDKAVELPDGRLRFSLSQFIDGEPIAPWTYEGTWPHDPNDVIPHEHRREVRGMYVLSSWLSHIDSRQENTMSAWIEVEGDRGYVRHYMIDFSDTLGILFTWDALARRFGHSGYFDVQHLTEDFLTLGLLDRPWHHAQYGAAGNILGYYDLERYEPDQWRPGYGNPAYERMTEHDAAWMTRIVARIGDEHLRALIDRGRWSSLTVRDEVFRIVRGRRDRVLERWLTRLSPLTQPVPEQDGARVCVEDLALTSGLRDPDTRVYLARGFAGDDYEPRAVALETRAEGRVCVEMPRVAGASHDHPGYVIAEIVARSEGRETTGPLRLHAYDLGDEVRIVGLERLHGVEEPRR